MIITRNGIWVSARCHRATTSNAAFSEFPFSRVTLGTSDNGGVHWNSGIMNLAFSLMVTGGKHPKGKTTNLVQALESDFTESIKAGARIFYDASANCLTPSSGFREARLCTLQLSGNYTTTVAGAWDAVGVTDVLVNTQSLTNGVALTGQTASAGELKYYSLSGVQGGEAVNCSISGSSGDADLFVSTTNYAVANTSSTANACTSTGSGSIHQCTTPTVGSSTFAYVTVKATNAFTDLSITCIRVQPPVANLRNGSPVSGLSLSSGRVAYYSLGTIKSGESVVVETTGNNGDADLYVRWGSKPVVTDSSTWNCYGYSGTPNESCTLTAPSDTTLYIAVNAYASFTGLSVFARHNPGVLTLSNGTALTSRSSSLTDLIQDYQLTSILVGDKVQCNLTGSTGDADLYVRWGAMAQTSNSSTVNACWSTRAAISTEGCTTAPAPAATTAYATVYTQQPYTGLSVSCSILRASSTTPPPSNTTNTCLAKSAKCTKASQCCSKQCSSGKCAAKKKFST